MPRPPTDAVTMTSIEDEEHQDSDLKGGVRPKRMSDEAAEFYGKHHHHVDLFAPLMADRTHAVTVLILLLLVLCGFRCLLQAIATEIEQILLLR